jgi:hypothetical protein
MKRLDLDNSYDSYEELTQNSESDREDQEINGTLSALSRPDTPREAYRRGFVEDLEAKVDQVLAEEASSDQIIEIAMGLDLEDLGNE